MLHKGGFGSACPRFDDWTPDNAPVGPGLYIKPAVAAEEPSSSSRKPGFCSSSKRETIFEKIAKKSRKHEVEKLEALRKSADLHQPTAIPTTFGLGQQRATGFGYGKRKDWFTKYDNNDQVGPGKYAAATQAMEFKPPTVTRQFRPQSARTRVSSVPSHIVTPSSKQRRPVSAHPANSSRQALSVRPVNSSKDTIIIEESHRQKSSASRRPERRVEPPLGPESRLLRNLRPLRQTPGYKTSRSVLAGNIAAAFRRKKRGPDQVKLTSSAGPTTPQRSRAASASSEAENNNPLALFRQRESVSLAGNRRTARPQASQLPRRSSQSTSQQQNRSQQSHAKPPISRTSTTDGVSGSPVTSATKAEAAPRASTTDSTNEPALTTTSSAAASRIPRTVVTLAVQAYACSARLCREDMDHRNRAAIARRCGRQQLQASQPFASVLHRSATMKALAGRRQRHSITLVHLGKWLQQFQFQGGGADEAMVGSTVLSWPGEAPPSLSMASPGGDGPRMLEGSLWSLRAWGPGPAPSHRRARSLSPTLQAMARLQVGAARDRADTRLTLDPFELPPLEFSPATNRHASSHPTTGAVHPHKRRGDSTEYTEYSSDEDQYSMDSDHSQLAAEGFGQEGYGSDRFDRQSPTETVGHGSTAVPGLRHRGNASGRGDGGSDEDDSYSSDDEFDKPPMLAAQLQTRQPALQASLSPVQLSLSPAAKRPGGLIVSPRPQSLRNSATSSPRRPIASSSASSPSGRRTPSGRASAASSAATDDDHGKPLDVMGGPDDALDLTVPPGTIAEDTSLANPDSIAASSVEDGISDALDRRTPRPAVQIASPQSPVAATARQRMASIALDLEDSPVSDLSSVLSSGEASVTCTPVKKHPAASLPAAATPPSGRKPRGTVTTAQHGQHGGQGGRGGSSDSETAYSDDLHSGSEGGSTRDSRDLNDTKTQRQPDSALPATANHRRALSGIERVQALQQHQANGTFDPLETAATCLTVGSEIDLFEDRADEPVVSIPVLPSTRSGGQSSEPANGSKQLNQQGSNGRKPLAQCGVSGAPRRASGHRSKRSIDLLFGGFTDLDALETATRSPKASNTPTHSFPAVVKYATASGAEKLGPDRVTDSKTPAVAEAASSSEYSNDADAFEASSSCSHRDDGDAQLRPSASAGGIALVTSAKLPSSPTGGPSTAGSTYDDDFESVASKSSTPAAAATSNSPSPVVARGSDDTAAGSTYDDDFESIASKASIRSQQVGAASESSYEDDFES